MRSPLVWFPLFCALILATAACTNKPAANNTVNSNSGASDNSAANTNATNNSNGATAPQPAPEQAPPKKEPVVLPAGTTVTVSLGSALGSKLSQSGQTFEGSVAKDVLIGGNIAIPRGANISGTVTDAKPLGKFAGGAVLQLRLDSTHLKGSDVPVQASLRTFNVKGKGKRTGVLAGGGAALGGLIGGLAGGGKGAAIGLAAGGGAGAGGAALTGNKDVVLPAEAAVSFQLSQPLQVQ